MSDMDDFGYEDDSYDDEELLDGFDDVEAEGDAEFAMDASDADDGDEMYD